MRGADGSNAGASGYAPAPAATDNNKALFGDAQWRAVSGTGTAATKAEADAGTDTTKYVAPDALAYALAAKRNPLATSGALALDGTTANAITTADNAVIACGLDDFSHVIKTKRTTYTPAAEVSLVEKAASNLGWRFRLTTSGYLKLQIGNGSNFTTYAYTSTVAVTATAYKTAIFAFTADRDGNVTFYENGAVLGAAVAMSGSAAQTVTSTGTLRLGYDGTTSDNCLVYCHTPYNLALSQADVTEIVESGGTVPERFKFGSQVAITSGTITTGKAYRITAAGGTFTGVGSADNSIGTTFVATGTTPTWGTGAVVRAGAVCHYDADADGIGYQLHDQSTNKLDAILTTTGVSWTKPARQGYVRGTLTWAGTHEAKSLLGQRALPASTTEGYAVTFITTKATAGSSGSGVTVGVTSNAALFVAANSYTTTKKLHAIANSGVGSGITDNETTITVDPDTANFTGSITTEVRYIVTEGSP